MFLHEFSKDNVLVIQLVQYFRILYLSGTCCLHLQQLGGKSSRFLGNMRTYYQVRQSYIPE